MARTKKQKEEDIRKFRAAGGRDRPTIQLQPKEKTIARQPIKLAPKEAEPIVKKAEERPTIKLEPKKTGIARDIKGAEELLKAGPLGDRSLAGRGALVLSVAPGVSAVTTFAKVGAPTIGKVATNPKTIGIAANILSKFFSKKTLAILGGAAGSIFLGQWGQAEAGEPISIAMRDALRQAQSSGDWSVYDDAKAARDELTNLSIWEKIALWTPISPIIGITNKIRGVIAGGVVLDAVANNEKIAQENGETDDDKWDRIREQQAEDEKANIDYYNEERKKMVDWEREAEKDARDADAAFWRKEKEKQAQMEAEDRKAIADFWLAYRKESLKIANDNRPSNLNFGLL